MSSSDLFSLNGKVACVTGASSGLGRYAAKFLAEQGAQVVGVARREEHLNDWRRETSGQTSAVAWDISDRSRISGLAEAIAKPFGAPDILVHAAGINTREIADEVTPEGWDITLGLNLSVPFFLCQASIHVKAAN